MPIIKSAKKKLRKDKKRTAQNQERKSKLKEIIKKATKNPGEKIIREAVSIVDKAIKRNILHKNKASRIKSRLAKLLAKPKKSSVKK